MIKFFRNFIILFIFISGASFILSKEPSVCLGSECFLDTSSTEDVQSAVASGEITLIDVREKSEWDEGHIEGAVFLPLGNIKKDSVSEYDKQKKFYVYCRSGSRAGIAVERMKELGFENVASLGGVLDWKKNGGFLVKD